MTTNEEKTKFINDTLFAHNKYRALVGSPPLVWDNTLAAEAEQWAKNMLAKGSMYHSGKSGMGENIAYEYNTAGVPGTVADIITRRWITNELPNFKYGKWPDCKINSSGHTVGHYTQCVWKATTKVGCYVAYNSSKTKMYICANYSKPGNIVGIYPY